MSVIRHVVCASVLASAHGVSCSSTAAVSIPVEANPDQQHDGSLDYSKPSLEGLDINISLR